VVVERQLEVPKRRSGPSWLNLITVNDRLAGFVCTHTIAFCFFFGRVDVIVELF